MTRLALVLSLTALGAACGARQPAAPPAEPARPGPAQAAAPGPAPAPAVQTTAAAPDTTDTPSARTLATFRAILDAAAAQGVAERPYGEIVQWTGEQLMGRPYVAGMLDAPPEETLVVDLNGFDCVLYIENVLAISRMVALGQTSYDDYRAGVEALRYRGGRLDGYCSRLHYFSEWILDNEARGGLVNVTREVGGERLDKRLTFMGEHRDAYPKLASDETYACVVDMESSLAGLELVYVPQDRIAAAYPMLQPGDVVATATSIGGLDVTHTGFVHKTADRTGFMHASLSSNRVKVSDDLQGYVQGIKSQIGVVIARPVDPRTQAPPRTQG